MKIVKKSTILLLRWLLFIVVFFLVLYGKERETLIYFEYNKIFLLLYVLSNIALGFLPARIFLSDTVRTLIFVADVVFVSCIIYFSSGMDAELYIMYFMVVLMSALLRNIAGSLVITVVVTLLYIGTLYGSNINTDILDTRFMIRVPFLFGLSLFSTYFAQEAKRYKLRASEMESLYNQVNVQLVRSSRLAVIGAISTGIIHEVNNLLQVIMSMAESVLRHGDQHEKNLERIKKICRVTEEGGSISRSLLMFARHDDNMSSRVDIKQALEESLDITKYILEKNRITVVREYGEDIPPVKGNNNQLKQVFINLINNAKDAMHEGGKLSIRAGKGENGVFAEFRDEGTGIPKKYQNDIFNPFFTTKESGKGTGLGLSVSREIIERHNGEINVETEEGRGTTFRIIFRTHKENIPK